jgi:putative ABC transport system ATP-binding protein
MLQTINVKYSYPDGKSFHFPDVTLTKGEQVIITGKSGSGKTTLLHLLSGILRATEGSVLIKGTDIQSADFKEIDLFRGRYIGLIYQKHFFIEAINMLENLLLAQSLPGLPVDKEFLAGLIRELDIEHLSTKYPGQLSQGELQRFSIARALANKPLLLLADEPTSSLDDENSTRFVNQLLEISGKYEITLLIATHDTRLKQIMKTRIEL